MVLLIDNYDSFSYNLVQLVGELDPDVRVVRNDEYTVEEIEKWGPSHIILSPGPGYPKDAGVCEEVVQRLKGNIPILGVCLGHEVFGAKICHARQLMHGKKSNVWIEHTDALFRGLPNRIDVARYHSLIADMDTIPRELKVISVDDRNEVMAGIPIVWASVSPRIDFDTGWQSDDREFFAVEYNSWETGRKDG